MVSEDAIVAICVTVFGAGGFWELLRRWLDRRNGDASREDLKKAVSETIDESQSIADIRRKLNHDFERLDDQDKRIHDLHLIVLRHYLFITPLDRRMHEAALQAGKEYLDLGGNGVGHTQVELLRADYERRMRDNDWDYRGEPR